MKLKNDILDLIFPPHCLNCDALGRFVCDNCRDKIIKIKRQSCPFCHQESEGGKTCRRCRGTHRLSSVVAYGFFHDPILKKIIHKYKYEGISAASDELALMLAELGAGLEFEVVSFAPMTKRHQNERGYNQAEALARGLARCLQKPLYKGLKKRRNTSSQVGLKRRERLQNLEGAFLVLNPNEIKGKRALLVDDVLTTGTTLEECAKVLKLAGAKQVTAIVLARE